MSLYLKGTQWLWYLCFRSDLFLIVPWKSHGQSYSNKRVGKPSSSYWFENGSLRTWPHSKLHINTDKLMDNLKDTHWVDGALSSYVKPVFSLLTIPLWPDIFKNSWRQTYETHHHIIRETYLRIITKWLPGEIIHMTSMFNKTRTFWLLLVVRVLLVVDYFSLHFHLLFFWTQDNELVDNYFSCSAISLRYWISVIILKSNWLGLHYFPTKKMTEGFIWNV